ncbi:predicted protein [Pyrenophora tritici-repentis Pt-1C-BFP]|uniref:Uncharacterized protein n=1 Tax=Pyrenophora tritici-repentis (strain Pt-1C-BFP) TaxID=426418 RepID=B2WI69_PYRTR|nr:uncharacterized protein PTRG_09678 [Pyrenophora tritici-repentis Pt-1C-BFP]EDU42729.1 predicted protein [Pyrenophora tritici-repentis Pt-1C-BFP]
MSSPFAVSSPALIAPARLRLEGQGEGSDSGSGSESEMSAGPNTVTGRHKRDIMPCTWKERLSGPAVPAGKAGDGKGLWAPDAKYALADVIPVLPVEMTQDSERSARSAARRGLGSGIGAGQAWESCAHVGLFLH